MKKKKIDADTELFLEKVEQSRAFIAKVKKDEKICVEPIRKGFIGKEVFTKDGTKYVQATRGPIIGYFAAVKASGKDKNVFYVGMSRIFPTEKHIHNVIGQSVALENALNLRKEKKFKDFNLKGEVGDQFEHFVKRCYSYFYPEQYAFSRGKGKDDLNIVKTKLYQAAIKVANTENVNVVKEELSHFMMMAEKKTQLI